MPASIPSNAVLVTREGREARIGTRAPNISSNTARGTSHQGRACHGASTQVYHLASGPGESKRSRRTFARGAGSSTKRVANCRLAMVTSPRIPQRGRVSCGVTARDVRNPVGCLRKPRVTAFRAAFERSSHSPGSATTNSGKSDRRRRSHCMAYYTSSPQALPCWLG
jgi:hypothetical protein